MGVWFLGVSTKISQLTVAWGSAAWRSIRSKVCGGCELSKMVI